ncbi:MAG TPA: MFS transporter [Gaiellaceae bacterium]|nr:MFS transporter [Gaiellaceae bacterium]
MTALRAVGARTFTSLRVHRNYRLFFSGQIISVVGTWMQNTALAWLVVDLTHSPVAVGFLAFCRFVPFSVFGLVAGVVADRFDNRRLVMTTQAFQMLVSIALAVLAFSGQATVWEAYALAVLGGTGLVFDAPGRNSLTYQMVGRDELPNAIALNASLFNASRVIGPAVAGLAIAATSIGVCFALNAVSFLAVLAALWLMRTEELYPVENKERPTVVGGTREGLGYVRGAPRIRAVLVMTLVLSTVGFNFHVLVPVLAAETLHVGATMFGVLSAVFGAGALVGALIAAVRSRASFKALVAGTGTFSVTMLVLAPQHTVLACAILLFITGISFTTWTANSQSILQLSAPDHLRGRVLSLYLLAFAGAAPLGGLLSGWLAHVGGTELAFSVAGMAGLVMTLYGLHTLRDGRFAPRPVLVPGTRR